MMRALPTCLMLILFPVVNAFAQDAEKPASTADKSTADKSTVDKSTKLDGPAKELFSGKVVLLSDALKLRKIASYEPEIKNQVVLETAKNELIPIVPDWRGRAFYQDRRLRDRQVDLVGYRLPGVPYLKVLSVFTFDKDGQRQFTDYWCDICSIPTYEIKPCECCQEPVRIRYLRKDLPDYLKRQSPKTNKPTADDGISDDGTKE